MLLSPGVLIARDFVKYSLPVALNEAMWGVSLMLYPAILGHMLNPASNLAAYTISGNIEKIFTVAVFASGNAVAVIIGKEIGAGRGDRVYSKALSLTATCLLLGLAAGALLLTATLTVMQPLVYPLFGLSPEAETAATSLLLVLCAAIPMRNMGFALGIGILRGGGDVKAVAIIDVGTLYILALPFAAISGLVFHASVGVVYSSVFIEEFIKTILLLFRVRSKKWINDVTRDVIAS
jgi:Na+-driven multidrug efflux pump